MYETMSCEVMYLLQIGKIKKISPATYWKSEKRMNNNLEKYNEVGFTNCINLKMHFCLHEICPAVFQRIENALLDFKKEEKDMKRKARNLFIKFSAIKVGKNAV